MNYLKVISFYFALAILIMPTGAFAYLDPGSGSYIIQVIVAGLLGGVFVVKTFWDKIKLYAKNIFYFVKNLAIRKKDGRRKKQS